MNEFLSSGGGGKKGVKGGGVKRDAGKRGKKGRGFKWERRFLLIKIGKGRDVSYGKVLWKKIAACRYPGDGGKKKERV